MPAAAVATRKSDDTRWRRTLGMADGEREGRHATHRVAGDHRVAAGRAPRTARTGRRRAARSTCRRCQAWTARARAGCTARRGSRAATSSPPTGAHTAIELVHPCASTTVGPSPATWTSRPHRRRSRPSCIESRRRRHPLLHLQRREPVRPPPQLGFPARGRRQPGCARWRGRCRRRSSRACGRGRRPARRATGPPRPRPGSASGRGCRWRPRRGTPRSRRRHGRPSRPAGTAPARAPPPSWRRRRARWPAACTPRPDETITTWPRPRSSMAGPNAWQQCTTPSTFTAWIQRQSSMAMSANRPVMPTPALHTSTSTAPTVAPSAQQASASVTSRKNDSLEPPASAISFATRSAAAASTSVTITCAPAAASAMQVARPIPAPPPVTSALAPSNSTIAVPLVDLFSRTLLHC